MGTSENWQGYKYFNTMGYSLPLYFIIWANVYYTHTKCEPDSAIFSWDLFNRVIKKLKDLIRVPNESYNSLNGVNKY